MLLLLAVVTAIQTERLRNRAEEGEQKLLHTYDYIIKFAERRLIDRPEELNELLSLVRTQYGDYLSSHRGNARFARQSAQSLTSLARITDLSGSRADALASYEEALTLWIQLAESARDDLTIQSALADTWHEIGFLRQGLGRMAESRTAYQKARDIRERLVAADPNNRRFLSALARSDGYIGDWELENGQRSNAEISYDKALKVRQRLHDSDPSDVVATFQLARSYGNSARLARESGKLVESIEANSEARKLQLELVALGQVEARRRLTADPLNVIQYRDFQNDLANTFAGMGVDRAKLDPANARKDMDAALSVFSELATAYQGAKRYAVGRDWVLVQIAAMTDSLDLLDDADKTFRSLMKDNRDVLEYQAYAARSLAVRGQILQRIGKNEEERNAGRRLLKEALQEQDRLVAKGPHIFEFKAQREQTRKALGL